MLVTCPACDARYEIIAEALGEGRTVRCGSCRTTWFAARESEAAEAATAVDEADMPGSAGPDDAGNVEDSDNIHNATEEGAAPPLLETQDVAPIGRNGRLVESNAGARRPAARKARKRSGQSPLRRALAVCVGAGLALSVVGVLERSSVVAVAPGLASFYAQIGLPVNLRGLTFHDVTSRNDFDEGLPILAVEGQIENVTGDTIEVPPLRLSLRGAGGEEIYAWIAPPPLTRISAGQSVRFTSKLVSPPTTARDVVVRFTRSADRMAGSLN